MIRTPDGYSEGRLVAMAVLCGDSLPEDKAWIIFDAIDTELSGSANKNDLVKFLDDLIFVATEVLPIAAVGKGQD